MQKHILAVLLILSLLLTTNTFTQTQAQEQEQYTLQLQGFTWVHTKISICIIPADNETWWNPAYINSTLRAINQWNEAFMEFSANYSDFAYLETLRITPTTFSETNLQADIYISWIESPMGNNKTELGIAKTAADRYRTIVNSTITLSAKNQLNLSISETDMQNILLHELGHSLGLHHSNYTGDLMYPTYILGTPVRAISSLNMLGIATVFQWMQNPAQLYPVSKWLKTSVTMSSDDYHYLPIADENLLPPQPFPDPYLQPVRTIIDYIIEFVLRPEALITILAAITVLVVVILLVQRCKKTENIGQNVLRQPHEFYEFREVSRLQSVVGPLFFAYS